MLRVPRPLSLLCRPGPDDKSKLASAFLKSATNVTVLGILVKHDAKAGPLSVH